MYSRPHVAPLRVLIAAGALTILAACGNEPTAPAPRALYATHSAHDDEPPTTPCRSGWQSQDGRWVCPDN